MATSGPKSENLTRQQARFKFSSLARTLSLLFPIPRTLITLYQNIGSTTKTTANMGYDDSRHAIPGLT